MSNENHNNTPDWRNKLEALHNLPGESTIDKNASWEKLHRRLREKKSNKKMIWYWLAAASLLLVLMTPLLNLIEKRHDTTRTGTVQKSRMESSHSILSDKKTPVQFTSRFPFKKNKNITAKNISIKKDPAVTRAGGVKLIRLSDTVSSTGFMKEAAIPALQPLNASLNTATAVTPNKKLKVVHINELGDAVEEPPGMVRNADIHSFQLKLADQEVYVNPLAAAKTNGFTIFKSKISPN